jgi:hypothetical protein
MKQLDKIHLDRQLTQKKPRPILPIKVNDMIGKDYSISIES